MSNVDDRLLAFDGESNCATRRLECERFRVLWAEFQSRSEFCGKHRHEHYIASLTTTKSRGRRKREDEKVPRRVWHPQIGYMADASLDRHGALPTVRTTTTTTHHTHHPKGRAASLFLTVVGGAASLLLPWKTAAPLQRRRRQSSTHPKGGGRNSSTIPKKE